eukprot:g75369.t1
MHLAHYYVRLQELEDTVHCLQAYHRFWHHCEIYYPFPYFFARVTNRPSLVTYCPLPCMAGFYRGTTHDQDNRFGDKNKKLKSQLKFPPEYAVQVDIKKVQLDVLKPWITQRVTELLGIEDEVVVSMVFNLLEVDKVDPQDLQIQLTGFMARSAKLFVLELWKLLISASRNPSGIPDEMLQKKKQELLSNRAEKERIEAELKRKKEQAMAAVVAMANGEKRKSRWDNASEDSNEMKRDRSDAGGKKAEKESSHRRSRSRSRSKSRERRRKESRSRSRSRSAGEKEKEKEKEKHRKHHKDKRDHSRSRSR